METLTEAQVLGLLAASTVAFGFGVLVGAIDQRVVRKPLVQVLVIAILVFAALVVTVNAYPS